MVKSWLAEQLRKLSPATSFSYDLEKPYTWGVYVGDLTFAQLRQQAQAQGIRGVTKLRKDKLEQLLNLKSSGLSEATVAQLISR